VNYVVFVLILMALILIHELGHFTVAKLCGMRVERFSIFFGRPLAKFTRGETEYRIGWLPLGGYVKITGMTREELFPPRRHYEPDDPAALEPPPPPPPPEVVNRAYFAQKPWKRIATIAAGPAVNILLAYLIFVVAFWIGPARPTTTIATVTQPSPAAAAGLRPGDRILAVNSVKGAEGFDAVRGELQSHPSRPVTVTVQRGGRTITKTVTLTREGTLGFLPLARNASSGFAGGFTDGASFTWDLVDENVRAIGRVVTDSKARDQLGTVVGIGAVYNQVSEDGLLTVLRYIGYLSLILGVFNLLPILPLDGGHILFTIIEWVKGSALSRTAYERTSMVGLALLMIVFVVALQNDIGRLSGEGFTVGR
jgi:regulator of sigma E protease